MDQVAAFIDAFWAVHHYAPSVRDIAAGCGLSLSTVHYHLLYLRATGAITFEDNAARTVVPAWAD